MLSPLLYDVMTHIHPTFDDFKSHYHAGRTQLVWATLPADLQTPVAAYLKLCTDQSHAFLLESIEGGATLGRYSVIGFDPDLLWTSEDHEKPLDDLKSLLAACRIDAVPDGLPPMAVSGMFGYMGYDMIRHVEAIPDANLDTLGIPESLLIRPRTLVIFDNVFNEMTIITPVYDTAEEGVDDERGDNNDDKNKNGDVARHIYDHGVHIIQKTITALSGGVPEHALNHKTTHTAPLDIQSNMTRDDFHAMVGAAKAYIMAGDIFQGVLSQRFSRDFDLPAFELYRSLRTLNPSPFMVHMKLDGFALVASSPEILVRVRDNTVTIRPIAGTRKRGHTAAEDKALEADLLSDPKECAEHLMLLDLGRNDVGRVAKIGSITVTEKFFVEYYSHVMHIVSNVEGDLRADLDCIDAHFAGFPAGTVSGAPKIRAMEIIDELEPQRRSFYGGSIGYFSGNGDMDTCIALRTALVKDGTLYVQAGAGIVADSDPESEYQETINKAKALFAAADAAAARYA